MNRQRRRVRFTCAGFYYRRRARTGRERNAAHAPRAPCGLERLSWTAGRVRRGWGVSDRKRFGRLRRARAPRREDTAPQGTQGAPAMRSALSYLRSVCTHTQPPPKASVPQAYGERAAREDLHTGSADRRGSRSGGCEKEKVTTLTTGRRSVLLYVVRRARMDVLLLRGERTALSPLLLLRPRPARATRCGGELAVQQRCGDGGAA